MLPKGFIENQMSRWKEYKKRFFIWIIGLVLTLDHTLIQNCLETCSNMSGWEMLVATKSRMADRDPISTTIVNYGTKQKERKLNTHTKPF